MRKALADIGVDAESQAQLFTLLSGLLWLGNIEFEESGTGDSTKVHRLEDVGWAGWWHCSGRAGDSAGGH